MSAAPSCNVVEIRQDSCNASKIETKHVVWHQCTVFLLFESVDLAALHTTHGTRKCRHWVAATPVHHWEEQSVANAVGPLCSLSDDMHVHRNGWAVLCIL